MGKHHKTTDSATEQVKISTEEELQDQAKKELLRDIKCASMRAEQFGAHSWAKPQKYVPSKRFLRHMLVSASRDNSRKSDRLKGSKASKITSAVLHQSSKNEHSSQNERNTKGRRSRWDSSPPQNRKNSHHKNVKKEKRHLNKAKDKIK